MSGNFKMDDYVDVAQRIHEFYERFPDGRLVTGSAPTVEDIGGKPFIWYHARAYRTPDDPLPGDGWAAEPVPGPTQFTFNSELMNAETAAWGRAIVALGFSTKKIASAQEVNARSGQPAAASAAPAAGGSPPPAAPSPDGLFRFPSGKNKDKTLAEAGHSYCEWYLENGPRQDVKDAINEWLTSEQVTAEFVPAGAIGDDDIPFDRTMDGVL